MSTIANLALRVVPGGQTLGQKWDRKPSSLHFLCPSYPRLATPRSPLLSPRRRPQSAMEEESPLPEGWTKNWSNR